MRSVGKSSILELQVRMELVNFGSTIFIEKGLKFLLVDVIKGLRLFKSRSSMANGQLMIVEDVLRLLIYGSESFCILSHY